MENENLNLNRNGIFYFTPTTDTKQNEIAAELFHPLSPPFMSNFAIEEHPQNRCFVF